MFRFARQIDSKDFEGFDESDLQCIALKIQYRLNADSKPVVSTHRRQENVITLAQSPRVEPKLDQLSNLQNILN